MKEERINLRVIPGKAELWSDAGGISWLRFAEGAEIDEKDMELIIEQAKLTFTGEKFKVVADMRDVESISDAARKFASEKDHEAIYSALAIIASSPATRLVANFFIQFHKPPRPTKIFGDTEKALKWLRSL